jgi:hypothetical protein
MDEIIHEGVTETRAEQGAVAQRRDRVRQ